MLKGFLASSKPRGMFKEKEEASWIGGEMSN